MFTFCPLQGALSESTASQSLLELDGGVKVLIDVGWDESFDVGKLKELEKQVPTLSLILLTHATVPHLAAYAHCCKNFPLFTRIPVYATRPVIDLGRTLTQDFYASTPLAATTVPLASLEDISYTYSQTSSNSSHNFLLQAPTPEDIARYFSLIQPLKYSQPHQPLPSPFSPPLNGLTITAYNAGHTLGGTIWHIQHGLESIVYAVDWNQARENVFAGAAWLSHGAATGGVGGGSTEVIEQLRKPTALVCSSRAPEAPLARARRDEQLLESLKLCVARGGTVLVPVDSSARVLELAYLLEHAWRAEAEAAGAASVLRTTKLYLAGRNIGSTMRNARSMLEWMDDGIVREFEAVADGSKKVNGADGSKTKEAAGPFDFKYLRLLERKAQVEYVLRQAVDETEPRGRVILASDASLEWGFSKEVLKRIASDARNLVILTEKPNLSTKASLSRTLWQWWKERRDGVATEQTANGDPFEQVYAGGRELEIASAQRQGLEGNELNVYQQWLATQRQLQAGLQGGGATALESAENADDASSESSSSSEESETEQQGKALNISTTMGQASRKKVVLNDEDLGITILLKKKGVYDFDVRGKKGRERMFPITIKRKRTDEFGDLIRPEDYLRAEEREELDGQDGNQEGKGDSGDNLGKKRKWDDVGAANRTSSSSGPNKRPQLSRNLSADEIVISTLASGPGGDELDGLEDEEEEPIMGPAKLVVSTDTVQVHLRIAFVDFSGLHDKRSLNMLIPLIQPRKLILVAGARDETEALAADCRKLLSARLGAAEDSSAVDVFTPGVGDAVDASVDTHAWAVKLADPLVKRLKWQNVRGLGIVTVTGLLVTDQPGDDEDDAAAVKIKKADGEDADGADSSSGAIHDKLEAGEDGANKRIKTEAGTSSAPTIASRGDGSAAAAAHLPVLDVIPSSLASAVRSAAQPLHVGDLRLADLRRAMQAGGHTAEFRGEGILVIDGTVAVRKSATGRIDVESVGLPTASGPGAAAAAASPMGAGGTFYAVRKMIYDGLAVVAGA